MMIKLPIPKLPKTSHVGHSKGTPKNKKGFAIGDSKGKKVGTNELAVLFGVSIRTIENWRKDGLPHGRKNGKAYEYDSAVCTRWKIDQETKILKDLLVTFGGDDEAEMSGFDAKRRKEVAQALTAELDLVIKREQVANIDDLMEAFSGALIEVRAKLVSMSSRLGGILSHQDEEGITKLLDAEVSDMLEVLSDYD
jgi:phage terminase Nu1 subunit (DNA packaging protein)